MCSNAIQVIEKYIYELEKPRMNLSKSKNAQRIYSRWAAKEILGYVMYRKDVSPSIAVEEFMYRMEHFSCIQPRNSYIFSVAYDIAADILDQLICS